MIMSEVREPNAVQRASLCAATSGRCEMYVFKISDFMFTYERRVSRARRREVDVLIEGARGNGGVKQELLGALVCAHTEKVRPLREGRVHETHWQRRAQRDKRQDGQKLRAGRHGQVAPSQRRLTTIVRNVQTAPQRIIAERQPQLTMELTQISWDFLQACSMRSKRASNQPKAS